ncbi:hypothetical protein N7509_012601 [Penicillium cosmopolitanum]|uniref:HypA-like protein n=1 Tax=Penicillium cosmopolitanum TaxID=1131564 RepID=A0A9W9VEW8_9EURO|nr:uncharacterized protein N7509_012601 [Penicillium cosmopolitanum]KAJ5379482.1 hypothetical protein N7509_012601 [Penicillium cosmopolitanum]
MATATEIHLSPATDSGVFTAGTTEEAARAASEVLQEDMENHHVFFNDEGFHNHIPHGVLSIFSLGASPDDIRKNYVRNRSYQRPARPVDRNVVEGFHDPIKFQEAFHKEENYSNYLVFFQEEIDAKGVGAVLNEYVFAGDQRAESMLSRLFGGLVHPLIHLGFGLEFNQPAIVAQALAQAAVHDDWIGREYFLPAEKLAGGIGKRGEKSLLQLLNEIRADEKLAHSTKFTDGNKIREGPLSRAGDEMLKYAAQYTVSEDQIQERIADMINTVVYYTSAAQRPDKKVKIDFFFIHCVNSSIFFSKIAQLPFLDTQAKLRLLEWKGRMDLVMYVSRGSPELRRNEVTQYPVTNDWPTLFSRAVKHPGDDGHLVKLVRALAHGEEVCRVADKDSQMPVSGDMWLRIGNMAIDSTVDGLDQGAMWIRSTGFDEAWTNLSGRSRL